LIGFLWDASYENGNQTPPSTATKNGVFTEFFVRSEVGGVAAIE
jgi:hypothetical protein